MSDVVVRPCQVEHATALQRRVEALANFADALIADARRVVARGRRFYARPGYDVRVYDDTEWWLFNESANAERVASLAWCVTVLSLRAWQPLSVEALRRYWREQSGAGTHASALPYRRRYVMPLSEAAPVEDTRPPDNLPTHDPHWGVVRRYNTPLDHAMQALKVSDRTLAEAVGLHHLSIMKIRRAGCLNHAKHNPTAPNARAICWALNELAARLGIADWVEATPATLWPGARLQEKSRPDRSGAHLSKAGRAIAARQRGGDDGRGLF